MKKSISLPLAADQSVKYEAPLLEPEDDKDVVPNEYMVMFVDDVSCEFPSQ